jgi:hypothetical protein
MGFLHWLDRMLQVAVFNVRFVDWQARQLRRAAGKYLTGSAIAAYGRDLTGFGFHFGNHSNSPSAQFLLHINIAEM